MPKTLADTLAARETMYAGRDRRPVFFTVIPPLRGPAPERNRDWKPLDGT